MSDASDFHAEWNRMNPDLRAAYEAMAVGAATPDQIALVLADVFPPGTIERQFDEAVARHRASGRPSITREEADRRADEAVANAHAAMRGAS